MTIKQGDKVIVEYEGRLETGGVFDSSEKAGKPLEFTVGAGQVIKGFEEAVIGMEKGQEKEVTIEPSDAYGEINPKLKKEVLKSAISLDQEPKIGMKLLFRTHDRQQIPVRIEDVKKETITFDMNPLLAGKRLLFKIRIVDIKPA